MFEHIYHCILFIMMSVVELKIQNRFFKKSFEMAFE